MKIAEHDLTERVLIVAEAGNNHEGDFAVARELVLAAAEAGADAIKFQTFVTDQFVRREDARRFAQMERFCLEPAQFAELSQLARAQGLLFLSTPLDLPSLETLIPLVDALKIASGDLTFTPLLQEAAATSLPLIVSTGASTLEEVQLAYAVIAACGKSRPRDSVLFLHCVSSYPVPPEQANVAAVRTLAQQLHCPVGYSDHTLGLDACLAAVAAGARLLEKHFTLDKAHSDFRDHQLSADPPELAELVQRVRACEALLGSGEKVVQPCEAELRPLIRRATVAARDLPAGHVFAPGDVLWQRPADGLPPGLLDALKGRTLLRPRRAGESLQVGDVADATWKGVR